VPTGYFHERRHALESTSLPFVRVVKLPRDDRIDLVRGYALASIFINHMPGNTLGDYTARNIGFSDAAELFVLLAGYAAALAYAPLAQRHDTWGIVSKAMRRAALIYGAHIVTTLAAIVMFWAVMVHSEDPRSHDLIGVTGFLVDPTGGLSALVSGGLQLNYFNILPLYVVLLCALPAMLKLATLDLRLLGAASACVYVATSGAGVSLPQTAGYDSWFFNPLAWQGLFAIGLALGIMRTRNQTVGYSPALYALAACYLAFSAGWTLWASGQPLPGGLPDWMVSLQKPDLPPARLLHVLALAYVVCHSRVWGALARVHKNFPLTRMGRHSLPVFMAGSLLSMAGWITASALDGGVAMHLAIAAVGISMMTRLASQLDRGSRAITKPEPAHSAVNEAGAPQSA
jgi:hypothetical protein